jgi:retron-type reverse transcriptase
VQKRANLARRNLSVVVGIAVLALVLLGPAITIGAEAIHRCVCITNSIAGRVSIEIKQPWDTVKFGRHWLTVAALTNMKTNEYPLYAQVRKRDNLKSAWIHVLGNGSKSDAKETRRAVEEFRREEDRHLTRIKSQLQKGKFKFKPAKGVLQKKKGKKARPIVVSDVESRIVQRSILDVLQKQSSVQTYLTMPTSFGAVPNRGVPEAIAAVVDSIKGGGSYFLRSDISAFFTAIPRQQVLTTITENLKDKKFADVLEEATNQEVQELESFGADKHYFDFDEVGTPQGCCLSPLLGNVLLADFDVAMNEGDIVCLRYLDDFILLGPNLKAVKAAFKRAQTLLSSFGLMAYEPTNGGEKASFGSISEGFEFLGVQITGKTIRPNRASQRRLIASVKQILQDGKRVDVSCAPRGQKNDLSFLRTMQKVSNKLKGWGNQYSFCNDSPLIGSMDKEVSSLIEDYRNWYMAKRRLARENNEEAWKVERRMLGVHLLSDSKQAPILW